MNEEDVSFGGTMSESGEWYYDFAALQAEINHLNQVQGSIRSNQLWLEIQQSIEQIAAEWILK